MNVVLLGYMASGKSHIGKLLAKKLKRPFVDLDTYIEQQEKMNIPEIFKKKGEIYFRKIESKYLEAVLNLKNTIISIGGGTPCYGENMHKITKQTASFYLKTSINTIVERIVKEKASRPLVAHLKDEEIVEFVGKHLFERNPFYQQAAHIISTDNKNENQIIDEIQKLI